MIEITRAAAEQLMADSLDKLGVYTEYGAVIGEAEFVIVDDEKVGSGVYLAHISEFETRGVVVRLKERGNDGRANFTRGE